MPPSTRRSPKDRPEDSGLPVERRSGEPAGSGQTQGEPTTMSLRLPFMTVSITRPRHRPAPGDREQADRGRPGTTGAPVPGSASGERLLFYTGVAALGAVGVLEWPVAAAIAAGTYIASKTRPTSPPPAPGAPGNARSAGAGPNLAAGAQVPVSTSPGS